MNRCNPELSVNWKTLDWHRWGLWPSTGLVGMQSPNCCHLCYSFVEKVELRRGYLREDKKLCGCLKAQWAVQVKAGRHLFEKVMCKWRSASLAKTMRAWTSHYLLADMKEETLKDLHKQRWTTEGNSEEEEPMRNLQKTVTKGRSRKIIFTEVFMLTSVNSLRLEYMYSICSMISSMTFKKQII